MLSVYYFAELLSGIGDALSKENYNLLLFYHDLNTIPGNIKYSGDGYSSASCNREYTMFGSDYEKYFIGKKVDGCILLGTYANDPSLLSLKKEGYKFCLVNNYIKNSGISFVDIDNIKGSFDAVEHLINLGHRDIAFFDVKPDLKKVRQPYKNLNDKRIKKRISEGKTGAKLYDWWNINQVKNVSKEKTKHPCQMPLQVMKNIIGILPYDAIIVDPFMGSGTTGVAVLEMNKEQKANRKFVGIELDETYFEIAKERIMNKEEI